MLVFVFLCITSFAIILTRKIDLVALLLLSFGCLVTVNVQGSKIALVRSYLRVHQAAGQVTILIFLVKITFFPYMPINFVM